MQGPEQNALDGSFFFGGGGAGGEEEKVWKYFVYVCIKKNAGAECEEWAWWTSKGRGKHKIFHLHVI